MIHLLVIALLAQTPGNPHDRHTRENRRTGERSPSVGGAFFEAFSISGAGTAGACSTTAPTGTKGETLTFTRASAGICTKTASGGLATTGIADGDLVSLATDKARVEYDSNGVLGLLVEGARTNGLLRSAELCNAAWTEVGTSVCTSDQATGPFGTATMDKLTDDNAAASEGMTQAITTASATQHTIACYVKAGTATTARLTLTGVGSSTGDCSVTSGTLSATTSTRVTCSSPAAYGALLTAVSVGVLVGSVSGDTGTVFVEGCDWVVSSAYLTSHIPTTSAAVTRAVDSAAMVIPNLVATNGCLAATVQYLGGGADRGWVSLSTVGVGVFRTMLYENAANSVRLYVNATADDSTTTTAGTRRLLGYWSAAATAVCVDGTCVTSAGNTETGSPDRLNFLNYGNDTTKTQDGIISRVQFDTAPTRCSP